MHAVRLDKRHRRRDPAEERLVVVLAVDGAGGAGCATGAGGRPGRLRAVPFA